MISLSLLSHLNVLVFDATIVFLIDAVVFIFVFGVDVDAGFFMIISYYYFLINYFSSTFFYSFYPFFLLAVYMQGTVCAMIPADSIIVL